MIISYLKPFSKLKSFTMYIFGIIYSHVNLSTSFYENQKRLVTRWTISNTDISLKALNGTDLIDGSLTHIHTMSFLKIILMCAWTWININCTASPTTFPFSNLLSAAPSCLSQNKHNLHSEQDRLQVQWSYFGWVIENSTKPFLTHQKCIFKIKPKWTRLGKFEGGQNGESTGFLPDSDRILLNHFCLIFTFNSTNFSYHH